MSVDLKANCYTSHAPLCLANARVIYGGSCLAPAVLDADLYVALDARGQHTVLPARAANYVYPIPDRGPPENLESFRELLEVITQALGARKKVHIGCVGGHGRTGLVLSALLRISLGDRCAIETVRREYCPKAVETEAQIEWLTKHFDIEPPTGANVKTQASSPSTNEQATGEVRK
ncbi:hypothetical protein [Bradyrhizobium sp. USDA 336]|uniref:hypothetical protein n=1 Tax=Bradyrhizobium sp. USDA 336 TaxID=3156311 RepID=UPI0038357C1C